MMKHMHPLSLSFYFKVYGKYVSFEVWFIRPFLVLISIMKLNIDQLKSVSCWIILINYFSVLCLYDDKQFDQTTNA